MYIHAKGRIIKYVSFYVFFEICIANMRKYAIIKIPQFTVINIYYL